MRNKFYGIYVSLFTSQCFGYFLILPFLSLYMSNLGATISVIGLTFAINELIQTLLRVPSGIISDIFGRRYMMLTGLFCQLFALFVLFISNNFLLTALAIIMNSIGISLFLPAAASSMSELSTKNNIGETMGKYNAIFSFSGFIGNLLGGFLISILSYNNFFLLSLMLTLAGCMLSFICVVETHTKLSQTKEFKKKFRNSISNVFKLLKNNKLLFSLASIFMMGFSLSLINSFYPIYASTIGMSKVMIGITSALNSFSQSFLSPYLGKVSDKFGRIKLIFIGFFANAIIYMLVPIFYEFYILVFLFLALSLFRALISPSTLALITENTMPDERGVGMGLWGMMMHTGSALGSFLMGIIASLSLVWIFYFNGLTILFGIAIIFVYIKSKA